MTNPPTGIVEGTPPQLELEWVGNALHVKGDLSEGAEACLEREVERAGNALDIDLSQLDSIGEDGLESLLKVRKYLEERDVPLRLVGPRGQPQRVFDLFAWSTAFEIVEAPVAEDAEAPRHFAPVSMKRQRELAWDDVRTELRRVFSGPGDERPSGFAIMDVHVTCPESATQVLKRAREALAVILSTYAVSAGRIRADQTMDQLDDWFRGIIGSGKWGHEDLVEQFGAWRDWRWWDARVELTGGCDASG